MAEVIPKPRPAVVLHTNLPRMLAAAAAGILLGALLYRPAVSLAIVIGVTIFDGEPWWQAVEIMPRSLSLANFLTQLPQWAIIVGVFGTAAWAVASRLNLRGWRTAVLCSALGCGALESAWMGYVMVDDGGFSVRQLAFWGLAGGAIGAIVGWVTWRIAYKRVRGDPATAF
jgi:hypothetical protein